MEAEKNLDFALAHCRADAYHNKRRILAYLIPIKLYRGRLPTPLILQVTRSPKSEVRNPTPLTRTPKSEIRFESKSESKSKPKYEYEYESKPTTSTKN